MNYRVRVEVRKEGSIGIFTWAIVDVQSKDEAGACRTALDTIGSRGLESRRICVRELVTPTPMYDLESYAREYKTLWEKKSPIDK